MNRLPAPLKVDMNELEFAFESENVFTSYLDRQTGAVLAVPGIDFVGDEDEEMEAAIELVESDPARFLRLESGTDLRPSIDDARTFATEVDDEPFRRRLLAALAQPRGAFRRFLDVLHEESGEIERWHHVRRQRLHARIAAWLAAQNVPVTYEPLPPWQPRDDVRRHLLAGGAKFVQRVRQIDGVKRIALIGSMTTAKRAPNDIDFLVTVTSEASVLAVAAAARKLQGHTQQRNRGADIFLADPTHHYLGRTCHWRDCGPGIRSSCRAQHCGNHLNDDLDVLRLPHELIANPPLVIWPQAAVHGELPHDVLEAFGLG
ncbi:MAG TPA: UPF0158 family protein [Thermoanaerobaculia bacterium]|jgi:predicted nucleotidyltransferase